jgi:hypothetical protein
LWRRALVGREALSLLLLPTAATAAVATAAVAAASAAAAATATTTRTAATIATTTNTAVQGGRTARLWRLCGYRHRICAVRRDTNVLSISQHFDRLIWRQYEAIQRKHKVAQREPKEAPDFCMQVANRLETAVHQDPCVSLAVVGHAAV